MQCIFSCGAYSFYEIAGVLFAQSILIVRNSKKRKEEEQSYSYIKKAVEAVISLICVTRKNLRQSAHRGIHSSIHSLEFHFQEFALKVNSQRKIRKRKKNYESMERKMKPETVRVVECGPPSGKTQTKFLNIDFNSHSKIIYLLVFPSRKREK